MTTPVVKENFPVYTCTRRLLGGKKGKGHHPIIFVDIPPQASAVGSILAKSCTCVLGSVLKQVGCRKRSEIIDQR